MQCTQEFHNPQHSGTGRLQGTSSGPFLTYSTCPVLSPYGQENTSMIPGKLVMRTRVPGWVGISLIARKCVIVPLIGGFKLQMVFLFLWHYPYERVSSENTTENLQFSVLSRYRPTSTTSIPVESSPVHHTMRLNHHQRKNSNQNHPETPTRRYNMSSTWLIFRPDRSFYFWVSFTGGTSVRDENTCAILRRWSRQARTRVGSQDHPIRACRSYFISTINQQHQSSPLLQIQETSTPNHPQSFKPHLSPAQLKKEGISVPPANDRLTSTHQKSRFRTPDRPLS
ncbi:hypothetical protein BKA64DRAFT_658419 [Cadophora sp. MPI-SDFR-AT-0126]|nr:hypothetical protein BKA64DRAFT_658419 [Leotiomycetes sp. MPI-SDFR-AT-0126]